MRLRTLSLTLAGLGLLGTLAAVALQWPSEGQVPHETGPIGATSTVAPDPRGADLERPVHREELPSLPAAEPTNIVEVLYEEGGPVADGQVLWGVLGEVAGSLRSVIRDGRSDLPALVVLLLEAPDDHALSPRVVVDSAEVEALSCVATATERGWTVRVHIPRLQHAQIRVTDLLGSAIADAVVRTATLLPTSEEEPVTTGKRGEAVVGIPVGAGKEFTLEVSAPGYLAERTRLVAGAETYEVRLRSLIGFAVIQDLRVDRWGVGMGSPPTEELRLRQMLALTEPVRAGLKLQPFERILWKVWSEPAEGDYKHRVDVRVYGNGTKQLFDVEVRRLTDPDFTVLHPIFEAAEAMGELKVDLRIGGAALSSVTDVLGLGFILEASAGAEELRIPQAVGAVGPDGMYSFWLRPGVYRVQSAELPFRGVHRGVALPLVQPAHQVLVRERESSVLALELEPGHVAGEFMILDDGGHPLRISAALVPPEFSHLWPDVPEFVHPFGGESESGAWQVVARGPKGHLKLGEPIYLDSLRRRGSTYLIPVRFRQLGIDVATLR